MKKRIFSILSLIFLLEPSWSWSLEALPKYGPKGSPKAVPLALSNSYFRSPKHPAPAFWALISHYIPQLTGASCGTASLAMTLNAARARLPKTSEEPVITEKALWEKFNSEHLKERLNKGGYKGQFGTDLDQLTRVTTLAFQSYGFPKTVVKGVHLKQKTNQAKAEVVTALKSLSDRNFILANFNQKVFTDDADVGHFAPVGAFDPEQERVLILDPDREYYEPYWVSLDTFMTGLATLDISTGMNRGYIVVDTRSE
jgi:hypothetical protein